MATQNKTLSEYERRFQVAAHTEKWAVTMTKVCIRQAVARTPFPRWHFVSFGGPDGGESRGVVDLIAIRKDHRTPLDGTKRGDTFQIILIQVKGGSAARPTSEDGERLRAVARRHHAHSVLLASWKKGKVAQFFSLRTRAVKGKSDWIAINDVRPVFG